MAALWRIRFGGKEIGPYPLRLFQMLRAQGRMPAEAEARREDGTAWVPFDQARDDDAIPVAAKPAMLPPRLPPPLPPPMPRLPPPLPARRQPQTGSVAAGVDAPAGRVIGASDGRFWLPYVTLVVLPLIALAAAIAGAKAGTLQAFDPRPWMLGIALLYLGLALHWSASTWWTWRRTAAFASEPRRILLRAGGVLYGLAALALVFAQQGLVFDLWRFAMRPDKFAGFSVSADAAAHTITIEGPLGFAASARFRQVLAANPLADTLVLNSPGGWIRAARGIAAQLAASPLHTVVVRNECASACTLIFEQVPQRVLEDGAHLGFHAGRNDLRDDLKGADEFKESMTAVLKQRAVPPDIIERINQTPNSGMWWPNERELFNGHLIDAVRLDRRDLPAQDYYLAIADQAMSTPETGRFYDSLRLFDPKTYDAVHAALAQAAATAQERARTRAITEQLLQPPERRALAHGGDQAQQQRARFIAGTLARLRTTRPDACKAFWYGTAPLPRELLSAAEISEQIDTMSALMRSALLRPGAQDGQKPDGALLARVYSPAVRRYGLLAYNTHAALQAGKLSDDDICAIAVSSYQSIAGLPPAEAGAVMRWLAVAS